MQLAEDILKLFLRLFLGFFLRLGSGFGLGGRGRLFDIGRRILVPKLVAESLHFVFGQFFQRLQLLFKHRVPHIAVVCRLSERADKLVVGSFFLLARQMSVREFFRALYRSPDVVRYAPQIP